MSGGSAWARHGAVGTAAEVRGRLEAETIPGLARRWAARTPASPVLRVDDDDVSHGELDDLVARAAAGIRAEGVVAGDRVVLCGPSSVDLVVAYLATLRLRAVAVFAAPTATSLELRHVLDDAAARIVLAAAGADGALDAARASGVATRPLSAAVHGDERVDGIASDPNDVAVLAYTSGTTGVPKGVPLTHTNLLASIRAATEAWRWSSSDVLLHALPLTHQHGLSGVHAALVHGARTIVRSRFDPADLLEALALERPTVLFAVPTIYERLLDHGVDGVDTSSLRLLTSGSAPMSPALFARVAAAFGKEPLERYGTTESGLDLSNPYEGHRRPGFVGLPLPGVELRIVDGDGSDVLPGDVGEIVLRGPQVFDGYWHRPEDTAAAFLDGEWFRTGDLARIDPADSYVVITGRSKDLIITGGLNVYPREVELALEEHPTVRQAGVLGVPSAQWGEEVCALVVAGDGFDPSALDAHARARLAPYKRPKRVVVVDELPFVGVGKLARRELPALLDREVRLQGLVPGDDA